MIANARSIKASDDPNFVTVAGDIRDPATARRLISEAVSRFGRVDTLVNNAGIFIAKPFTAYTAEDYAAVLNVNLNGFFYITQFAITEMEKNKSGHVVNITTSLLKHAIDGVLSVLASLTKGGFDAAIVAGDRIRKVGHPCERRRARRHHVTDACSRNA